MATFSNQHFPIVLNSLEDNMVIHTSSFFSSQFDNPQQQLLMMPLQFHQTPYTIDSSSPSPSPNMLLDDHLQLTPMLRNREKITHFPKVVKEDNGRNQSRPSNAAMSKNGEKKKHQNNSKGKIKINKVSPTQYIHVRARRGQATDSHSLAERVRREKINEKMRLLQSIVPGCDKVIGKTQVLDEIINYIQSLQYQVEFLFGKLSPITPMINDYQSDFDTTTLLSEDNDLHLWEIKDQGAQFNMLSPL